MGNCGGCGRKVSCKGCKGDRGPRGPKGDPGSSGSGTPVNVIGIDGVIVTESLVGGVQTFTVSNPKEFFYEQLIQSLDISVDPAFVSMQYFSPAGYTVLTYTNLSTVEKKYEVHASYEHAAGSISANSSQFGSWVDAAIIKNASTVMYETDGIETLSGYLYWGPNPNDTIGSGTPVHNLPDNQGSNVGFRFLQSRIPLRMAFFCPVTLAPGEKVTLKFRTKDSTQPGTPALALLKKAQIMVKEL